jgi:hypothetical protein
VPTLLVVHHTPSPAMAAMFEAVVSGARTDDVEGVEVIIRPALTAAAADVLQADGYLLGTPANIGYMSGALKHFFDGIYYPCLEATRRRPFGLYVHGASDTGGAVRSVESITAGLQWRPVRPPVCVAGTPGKQDLQDCWELGALLAAELAGLAGASPDMQMPGDRERGRLGRQLGHLSKSALLCHAAGGRVVSRVDELEPVEEARSECPPRHGLYRQGRDTATTELGRGPVAHLP